MGWNYAMQWLAVLPFVTHFVATADIRNYVLQD